jgi:hypothetical protein
VIVPDELVQRWEDAYRRYGEASKASVVVGDQQAARAVASTSWQVAAVLREMDARSRLPWWMAAAVCAAAEAFEFQARDWSARAERTWSADTGPWDALQRLPARPRPGGEQR